MAYAFSSASGLPEANAKAIWAQLKNAIIDIQHGRSNHLRYEELYRFCYTLVLYKYGDMVYDGAIACIRANMENVKMSVLNAPADRLLEALIDAWNKHKMTVTMIRDILLYLNRTYCKLYNKPDTYEVGLYQFRECILTHPDVAPRIRKDIQDAVNADRAGEKHPVDRTMIRTAVNMLIDAQVNGTALYQQYFEDDFLQNTQLYYRRHAEKFFAEHTVPEYLQMAEEKLREEERRADAYIDKSTRVKLRALVQHELLVNFAQRIVDEPRTGVVPMFTASAHSDLARLYKLFLREPAKLELIANALGNLVKSHGKSIVTDPELAKDPMQLVQKLLDCRDKYHKIVAESFGNDRNFSTVLRSAVEYFVNTGPQVAGHLSAYIDNLIRSNPRLDDDTNAKINSMIFIFRYLNDKDIFETCYKKHLSMRLVTGSYSLDLEKQLVGRFKQECGHQFTSRIEGMLKDVEISQELMGKYKNYSKADRVVASRKDDEFSVLVATSSFWPLTIVPETTLPEEAKFHRDRFTKFYTDTHQFRKLAWQTCLGTAQLLCQFDDGKHELLVSTIQMTVLMLYNKKDKYTFGELAELTKVPPKELQRHLLSLAHPQVKILAKNPNTMETADDHTFQFNSAAKLPGFRVRVPLLKAVAPDQAQQQGNANLEAIKLHRRFCTDAAIVRVMKHKKQLEHNALVEAVTAQLANQFRPDPAMLKQRIEHLIEVNFLERDATNRRAYKYVA